MATLIKIKDNKFQGNHPNGINKGYFETIEGVQLPRPIVGESYKFGSVRTSKVIDFDVVTDNAIIIETENSTYLVAK